MATYRSPAPELKSLADAEILALSTKQPGAFEELVDRYERAFLRKAESILQDNEDASDAVQETFVRIYVHAAKYRSQPGASFSSWAYAILVNQCYTAYKKKHRAIPISLDADPDLAEVLPDQAATDAIEGRLVTDQVMRLLSKLPVLLRRAVEMHFLQGLSQKEIAAEEGVSHGTVRQRIYRAKRELRKLDLSLATAAALKLSSD